MASNTAPSLEPPSPKNTTATLSVPLSRAAKAAPTTNGAPAPTMPLAPSMPFSKSAMCIEPPLPWQTPVFLP
ncbi:hypothetical protein D3C84_839160 [compost metagenome]